MQKNTIQLRGGLLINKPKGITSHDVIYKLRNIPQLDGVKIGHSGTLDPFATGVLLVLLGGAVRLQDELHLLPKTYTAEITLGAISDTDDVAGNLQSAEILHKPSQEDIAQALDAIKHQTTQIPPAYSAIKLKGKKMYEYARKGEIVEQKPRKITIHEITLLDYSYPILKISVTCSTGTYIRSIARDIGELLRTGGYCSQLERTAIGNFAIQKSVQLESIPENINSVLISLEQLTEHLASISFNDSNVAKLKTGREVEIPEKIPLNTPIALKSQKSLVFGIGMRPTKAPFIIPKKIFL
ncbi:MAG: tRNA pseudouridine(55) synthase TruB [Candidatus Andersenbacteria bacterium]